MKNFPTPLYHLGAEPARLLGSNAEPHYIVLDAAAIHNLKDTFPKVPNQSQKALLNSLAPDGGTRPVIFMTTPLELMICDFVKQQQGKKGKPVRVTELASISAGQLVIRSYKSMRSRWYLYQPFTLRNVRISSYHYPRGKRLRIQLEGAPFKIAGDLEDNELGEDQNPYDSINHHPVSHSSAADARMQLRVEAFHTCAGLLKNYRPGATFDFLLAGSRMLLPPVSSLIRQKLAGLGSVHVGNVRLVDLIKSALGPVDLTATYSTPKHHSPSDQQTFAYPDPNLEDLQMNLRALPFHENPGRIVAPTNTNIYIALDTNVHSRFPRELEELSRQLGQGCRIITLPTAVQELGRGDGKEGRMANLSRLKLGRKITQYEKPEMRIGPVPLMGLDGLVTDITLKGDLAMRTEFAKVKALVRTANPFQEHILLFGTLDIGCHFLFGSIESGYTTILIPKLEFGDKAQLSRILVNLLWQ